MKQIFAIIVALAAVFTTSAQSSNTDFDKKIDNIIAVAMPTSNFEQIIYEQISALANNGMLSEAQIAAICKDLTDEFYPTLMQEMHRFYAENFTAAEIAEIENFVTSPVGKKQADLSTKALQAGMKVMETQESIQAIQRIVSKHIYNK